MNDIEKYRWNTQLTKEPETIAWIDTMKPGEVFWDIGANVGVYSAYAAERGLRVVAFEPHPPTYARLCENVNGLDVTPLMVAVYDKFGFAPLHYKSKDPGSSGHQVLDAVGEDGKEFEPVVSSTVLTAPAWWLVNSGNLPSPDHIKVDVDGQETLVLAGLKNEMPTVSSCLFEFRENTAHVAFYIESLGFRGWAELNQMTPHSRERRAKEGIDAENWIFRRK